MNILITGGTGLVGQKLAKKLISNGHKIYVLTRNKKKHAGFLSFPCELLTFDELSLRFGKGLSFQAVFNLAGEPVAQRWNSKIKDQIYNSRIEGTKKIINLFKSNSQRVDCFISASAIGYYGDRGDEVLTEDSKPDGVSFLSKVCVDWEKEASLAQSISERVVQLRIGIVLAEGEGALKQMIPPFQNGVGGVLGDGANWMSWIHCDDLVEMFLWALNNKKANGIYNAVSPAPETNKTFSQKLAASLKKSLFLPVPKLAVYALYGEMAKVILSSQKVMPQKIIKEGFHFKFSDLESALKSVVEPLKSFENKVVFEQWVPKTVEQLFPFFEDEKNLEIITPPWLNFKVLDKTTELIQKGTLINYQLKLYGIPFKWTTLILDFKKNEFFIDTQKKGPYEKWHHTHEFESLGGGTIVRDIIRYRVPLSGLGKLTTGWKVDSDVQKIFKFRSEKIKEIFN